MKLKHSSAAISNNQWITEHFRRASMRLSTLQLSVRGWLFICVFAALVANSGFAQEKAPSKAKLGVTIPNLTFRDAQGKALALHDLRDKKAIVVVFLSFECPVSNSY